MNKRRVYMVRRVIKKKERGRNGGREGVRGRESEGD